MSGGVEDIDELEAALAGDPGSEELRERLLEAYAMDRDARRAARRAEHIEWFVVNRPRSDLCRTAYMFVDAQASPELHQRLRGLWFAALEAHPGDSAVLRGAVNFLAGNEPGEAERLLRDALASNPERSEVWLDLGRLAKDPAARVAHLERARELGDRAPNLLVWIARAAAAAGDLERADRAGRELLQLVKAARKRFGDKLDWPDRGGELWSRARKSARGVASAQKLVQAHSDHAYRKHWGHTVRGLVACARGDVDAAVRHLRESADVVPDSRLSAYGPAVELARAVCQQGRWSEAAAYLRAWQAQRDDARVDRWLAQVERAELPDAPDAAGPAGPDPGSSAG